MINEDGKKIGERIAKDMNFEKLIKSCDIGLSSVVALKKIFNDNLKFPNLKTKEAKASIFEKKLLILLFKFCIFILLLFVM